MNLIIIILLHTHACALNETWPVLDVTASLKTMKKSDLLNFDSEYIAHLGQGFTPYNTSIIDYRVRALRNSKMMLL